MANKLKVYGKAQNRTALGIMHAYMIINPDATIEDLRKAFPNALNPDRGTDEIFIYSTEEGSSEKWDGHFKGEDELLSTGDGKKVAVVKMWTAPSFERTEEHAKQYGIEIEKLEKADKGFGNKGGFEIEYLNGWSPDTKKAPDFKIDGRMKVKTLKDAFNQKYGGILHIKDGNKNADDNATIASIRSNEGAKGGELVCRASRTVGIFEEELWEVFGIKANVFTGDDWVAVLDGITLGKIKDIPKQATKAKMEDLIAYKRK